MNVDRPNSAATAAHAGSVPGAGRWLSRTQSIALLVCGAGLAARLVILGEYLSRNPFAKVPIVDADVYWRWAGEIAYGKFWPDTPFFSAPLYPYFLALLRYFGAGLPAVYAVQCALDVGTALLVGSLASRLAGRHAGIVAIALYWLLNEPAAYSMRVLNCSLPLFLIAACLVTAIRACNRPSLRAMALAGACAGLMCLAYPPGVLIVAALAGWLALRASNRRIALAPAVAFLAIAAAIISPATWHNYRRSGSLFLIQAVSGITLQLGNLPESTGTYTVAEGIEQRRDTMHLDAWRRYEKETGRAATWADVDRFCRDKATAFWRNHPGAALRLFAQKAYYFLTARNYGDIYVPTLERSTGLNRTLALAPLPTPWLIPLALAGLFVCGAPIREKTPLIAAVLVPLITVILFWYSPRFRMPILPAIVPLAAAAICDAVTRAAGSRRPVAGCAAALAVALGLTGLNSAIGFDSTKPLRANFDTGVGFVLEQLNEPDRAIEYYRRLLAATPDNHAARSNLGKLLAQQSRYAEAIPEFERALRDDPRNALAHLNLANALAAVGNRDDADAHYRAALEINPDYALAHAALGALRLDQPGGLNDGIRSLRTALEIRPDLDSARLLLAAALVSAGEIDAAVAEAQRIARRSLTPGEALAMLGETLVRAGQARAALGIYERLVADQPDHPGFRANLATLLVQAGRAADALPHLQRAVQLRTDDARLQFQLGMLLQHLDRRDEAIVALTRAATLEPKNTLAHVQAAVLLRQARRYDEARHLLEQALRARPDDPIAANSLAWLRATCPEPSLQNADEAIRLAESACTATENKNPYFLDTLAAAYARRGDFEKARRAADLALELARSNPGYDELAREIESRATRYRSNQPYVEGP